MFFVLCAPSALHARLVAFWTYYAQRDNADLVVIATPVSVQETKEIGALPNIWMSLPDGTRKDIMAVGMETAFEAVATLKGDKKLTKFVLHHYRLLDSAGGWNDPRLVSFGPNQRQLFLMFLKQESDGRYGAANGQTDPAFCITPLSGWMGRMTLSRIIVPLLFAAASLLPPLILYFMLRQRRAGHLLGGLGLAVGAFTAPLISLLATPWFVGLNWHITTVVVLTIPVISYSVSGFIAGWCWRFWALLIMLPLAFFSNAGTNALPYFMLRHGYACGHIFEANLKLAFLLATSPVVPFVILTASALVGKALRWWGNSSGLFGAKVT